MALSIQHKFRCEISEIPSAIWNGTFRLHRPGPSHHTFGYCSCKQVTKYWYWGPHWFCQMERVISVRPTRNDQKRSKRTTFKAGPEYSGRTKAKWSFHLMPTNWNFRNLGLNAKRPNTTEHLWGNKECAESAWPTNQAGSPHMIKPGPKKGRKSFV